MLDILVDIEFRTSSLYEILEDIWERKMVEFEELPGNACNRLLLSIPCSEGLASSEIIDRELLNSTIGSCQLIK